MKPVKHLLVSPLSVQRYVEYMQKLGFETDDVFAGSGLNLEMVSRQSRLIDFSQCQAVIRNMIELTENPAIGLAIGQSVKFSDFGIVGHALMSSKSVRQASQLWLQYNQSLLGIPVSWVLEENRDKTWQLKMFPPTSRKPVTQFCTEEMLAAGISITNHMLGEPLNVSGLQIAYREPEWSAEYEKAFQVPITFGTGETILHIANPPLDHALRNNEDVLSEICLSHCNRVMHQLPEDSTVSNYLRSLFLRNAGDLPTLDEAADYLGLGPRTLRRRLAAESTSYQKLVQQFRHDLAIEYLKSRHMTPKEISYTLGFYSPSDFRRAFKSWTGMTVGQFLETAVDNRV